MDTVEHELDRILMLLRNKIRERGFTQLQVQERLDWGRSYISQLLTKQKSLRVEQVLRILQVIGVEAAEFYAELYRFPRGDSVSAKGALYPRPGFGASSFEAGSVAEVSALSSELLDELRFDLKSSRQALEGLLEMLVEKQVLEADELEALRGELMPARADSAVH